MTGQQHQLLRLARQAIETALHGGDVPLPADAIFQTPAAVFVTLREHGDLRGCVGSIEADQPLGRAVVSAARAAAFTDPRFAPLSIGELDAVRIEISVLSPLVPLPVASEAEAIRALARTRPGVLLRCGHRQGLLLPKVWESVADAAEFLRHLKRKAGLPADYWSEAVELLTFTTDECAEADEPAARTVQS